jgi:hypothetical protein
MKALRKCDTQAHMCTVRYYSVIKKNKILSFVGKWMKLENIISEVSQA